MVAPMSTPSPSLRQVPGWHAWSFVPLLLGAFGWVAGAAAQELPVPDGKPRWEAGVAFLGANSPDYPAAGTRDWRGVIAPIVIYRGPWLRIDDNGVRGRIFDTERFELDLSGAAGFNARSNAARAGMPDLDYTLEVGPQAVYRIPLSPGQQFSAHLKARAVISTDGRRTNGRGMVVEQELRWSRRGWPDAASEAVVAGHVTWASEDLQDYYYQVEPEQATAVRPAYDARSGYFGSMLRAGLSRRLSSTTAVSVSGNVSFHGGAANRESPLFARRTTAGVLFAFIWTPLRSEDTVPR
jgi:outer membrane protein